MVLPMESLQLTDERLRHALNGNQPSRERMCLEVLALDRNYTDIKPRRPEGGPDGGRDIECRRGPDVCFGAVGFLNSVSDTAKEKRQIEHKFKLDLEAAIEQMPKLKAFVFLTNIDLTPSEVNKLKGVAESKGISFVDIYWRERIRLALDGAEGLAIRYRYLSLPLSEAEQAAFFSRFGKDLERLVVGKFDRLEEKLDELEFARWKAGPVRMISLEVVLKELIESKRKTTEHFRVCMELQGVVHERRSIIIGGRDDYWRADSNSWYLGTKTFFYRERHGEIENSWIPNGPRAGGGQLRRLQFGVRWRPISPVLAMEFDGLYLNFHCTENLFNRIARVRLMIDSYTFLNARPEIGLIENVRPSLGWPEILSAEEEAVAWRFFGFGSIDFDQLPEPSSPDQW